MSHRSGTVGLLVVAVALSLASCGEGLGGASGGSAPTATTTTIWADIGTPVVVLP